MFGRLWSFHVSILEVVYTRCILVNHTLILAISLNCFFFPECFHFSEAGKIVCPQKWFLEPTVFFLLVNIIRIRFTAIHPYILCQHELRPIRLLWCNCISILVGQVAHVKPEHNVCACLCLSLFLSLFLSYPLHVSLPLGLKIGLYKSRRNVLGVFPHPAVCFYI